MITITGGAIDIRPTTNGTVEVVVYSGENNKPSVKYDLSISQCSYIGDRLREAGELASLVKD